MPIGGRWRTGRGRKAQRQPLTPEGGRQQRNARRPHRPARHVRATYLLNGCHRDSIWLTILPSRRSWPCHAELPLRGISRYARILADDPDPRAAWLEGEERARWTEQLERLAGRDSFPGALEHLAIAEE